MTTPDPLVLELREKIVSVLGLTEVRPEDIEPDAPLAGASLGLDSVDLLELVVMVERDYGVTIQNRQEGETAFRSVRALAEHIAARRQAAAD